MAHSYSHLFGIPTTGLRFFTVYGPWGRPDMALFKFTRGILAGEPIPVYNRGQMDRDFTYVDDIVEGVVVRVRGPSPPGVPRIFNIGNNQRVPLMRYIEAIEAALGRRPSWSCCRCRRATCWPPRRTPRPWTPPWASSRPRPVEEGVRRFVEWYREYYSVPK